MLYVTTRNKNDAHTAHKTLSVDRAPDGGMFVPYQLPLLNEQELEELKEKSFGQCVAYILNLFFSARLDNWDIDFAIGRSPVKLIPMSHKIVVAETWHNADLDFARMVRNLSSRIQGAEDTHGVPSNWAWIVIRIASLFGIYSELCKSGFSDGKSVFDVAVTAGDFSSPMAVWYAREMGLPIGTIICSCNDNGGAWDLLHHGEIRTDAVAIPTNTPESDVGVPSGLERLIYHRLGVEESARFARICQEGRIYSPGEERFHTLRAGLYAAVVSQKRMESVIYNIYRTNTYLLDPYSALAYGGLQDYRASAGESRTALLITERSPICSAATVAKVMGVTVQELKERTSMA